MKFIRKRDESPFYKTHTLPAIFSIVKNQSKNGKTGKRCIWIMPADSRNRTDAERAMFHTSFAVFVCTPINLLHNFFVNSTSWQSSRIVRSVVSHFLCEEIVEKILVWGCRFRGNGFEVDDLSKCTWVPIFSHILKYDIMIDVTTNFIYNI